MDRARLASTFNELYLGDSLLEAIELKTAQAECRLRFNAGKILKGNGASIFDPKARFEPALLCLHGVRSIACGGVYQLNSTVVDFGAAATADGQYVDFYFDLTGGTDPDAYLVRINIVARSFDFGPWNSPG